MIGRSAVEQPAKAPFGRTADLGEHLLRPPVSGIQLQDLPQVIGRAGEHLPVPEQAGQPHARLDVVGVLGQDRLQLLLRRLPRARVTIVAIEGEGTGEKALPEPIAFTLQAGIPQEVQGICQGPEGASWVFLLEAAAVRVTSRGCEYPVRGLRPRLRISAVP